MDQAIRSLPKNQPALRRIAALCQPSLSCSTSLLCPPWFAQKPVAPLGRARAIYGCQPRSRDSSQRKKAAERGVFVWVIHDHVEPTAEPVLFAMPRLQQIFVASKFRDGPRSTWRRFTHI